MKKSSKVATGIIIVVVVFVIYGVFRIVHGVFWFLGYETPIERYYYKLKTDAALEEKYPGHDFDVREEHDWGEYGFAVGIYGKDEAGIEFWVQWVDGEMQDRYCEEWNKHYYGKKIVEYQNGLRDKYFPQIPYVDTYEYSPRDTYNFFRGSYKEVFFESMDDAIEGSKYCDFNTDVTFKGIDLYTADDEEIKKFAESIADSLMWLTDETGYRDIRIGSFYYRKADEYGSGFKNRDELVESIKKEIMAKRKTQ
ncbi:MAG: hypothetical protein K6A90_04855 [Lachnospiraceae bacterium]|nr:hypothetical protein [Lachnospiraceae bacterium]